MRKPHALIESLSANLSYFITQIHHGLPLPQKNFLHESIIGLIRAGHPIVAHMARQIGRHDTFNADRTRLEYNLNNESQFDQKIKDNLPNIWLPFIKEDTPIILDLSDIAKPLAKRMDYLATVRDGSSDQLVNGYSLIMSARQNGVEPFRYMRDVIERISAHPKNELNELLPTKIYKKTSAE